MQRVKPGSYYISTRKFQAIDFFEEQLYCWILRTIPLPPVGARIDQNSRSALISSYQTKPIDLTDFIDAGVEPSVIINSAYEELANGLLPACCQSTLQLSAWRFEH